MNRSAIIGAFASFAICLCAGAAGAQSKLPAIIDVHSHLVPAPGPAFDQALASAVSNMNKYGVEISILMSPPRSTDVKGNYDAEDLKSPVRKYPGRFVLFAGGGSLNRTIHGFKDPSRITDAVRDEFAAMARREIDEGAIGFGEISSLHISLFEQHIYAFVPADHPLILLLADIAAERNVPIDLHMDAASKTRTVPPELAKFSQNPEKFPATISSLERLLAHNRNAKIVWAHGGTDHIGDFSAAKVGELLDRYSNLYLSLKVAGPKTNRANMLFRGNKLDPIWLSVLKKHSDRFVIGTDNFYADPASTGNLKAFSKAIEPRMKATSQFLKLLPRDLAEKIARTNAIRIYRIAAVPHISDSVNPPAGAGPAAAGGPLCKDGNLDHCRIACRKGNKKACARLEQ